MAFVMILAIDLLDNYFFVLLIFFFIFYSMNHDANKEIILLSKQKIIKKTISRRKYIFPLFLMNIYYI